MSGVSLPRLWYGRTEGADVAMKLNENGMEMKAGLWQPLIGASIEKSQKQEAGKLISKIILLRNGWLPAASRNDSADKQSLNAGWEIVRFYSELALVCVYICFSPGLWWSGLRT
jgi:hypothetical protein